VKNKQNTHTAQYILQTNSNSFRSGIQVRWTQILELGFNHSFKKHLKSFIKGILMLAKMP